MIKTNACLVIFALLFALGTVAEDHPRDTQANVVAEITFTAAQEYKDPFNEVTMDVTFIDPTGREVRVPAFWDGKNIWKVRYASPVIGEHSFRSESTFKSDAGLNGVTGKLEIKPYTGTNPLYIHGPARIAEDHRHLKYADGTPFFWLGDTWWMGLCHRLHWPDEVKILATDRVQKGFTVIQIVAGLYPDMFPFDPRGANEAGFPWEKDYARIRPEYFDEADKRLFYLADQGLSPCIVGAWGYFMPWMGVHKMEQHWRYLIARYGALPVMWCAAGEANLPWYLAKGFPYDDRKQVTDWTQVMRYIRETDPYHRLLTIHPTGIGRLSARHATDDLGVLDIDMLQTPHGEQGAVAPTVNTVRESYADKPVMPVIDGEAAYEQLGGTIKTEWTRRMFWLCMMNGAAGHTYGANGIWQCNRKGQPHGPSPTAGSPPTGYGTISWDEAMNLGGSRQEGLGKKLFEEFPWQDFHPHPEWASYSNKASISLEGCNWIWFPEGAPAQNAPAGKRYFRRTFVIPQGKTIKSAQLRVTADDRFAARLNGKPVGTSPNTAEGWKVARQFNDLGKLLKPGENVIAIEAENLPANGANPAGLIARLEIHFTDGSNLKLTTNADWHVAKEQAAGWDNIGFDDAAWSKAAIAAKYGDSPWGAIDGTHNDDAFGPQSAGIPGVVRMIYVPDPREVSVRGLGVRTLFAATIFDPVTGEKTTRHEGRADDRGDWTFQPPPAINHDWVLLLEAVKHAGFDANSQLTLENDQAAWHLDWSEGQLRTTSFDNKLSGHMFAISKASEIGLVFSASLTTAAQPFTLLRDFQVTDAKRIDPHHADVVLHSPSLNIDATAHFELDGPTRRKWFDITNRGSKDLMLLDVNLDDLETDGLAIGGGEGEPIFLEEEAFAAVEHPAGVNQPNHGRIQLAYYPGRKLAAGESYRTHTAIISVANKQEAHQHFLDYIQYFFFIDN